MEIFEPTLPPSYANVKPPQEIVLAGDFRRLQNRKKLEKERNEKRNPSKAHLHMKEEYTLKYKLDNNLLSVSYFLLSDGTVKYPPKCSPELKQKIDAFVAANSNVKIEEVDVKIEDVKIEEVQVGNVKDVEVVEVQVEPPKPTTVLRRRIRDVDA